MVLFWGQIPARAGLTSGASIGWRLAEGIAFRFALPQPSPGPAIVEGATAEVFVRSPIAVKAGSTVMIRLLVEEGERFIDPDGPNVVAEDSLPGRLVVELPLTGDGTTLEHALMLPTRDDNRPELGEQYPPDIGRATARCRVPSEHSEQWLSDCRQRQPPADYGLTVMHWNMQADLCARLSSVVFTENGSGERPWVHNHVPSPAAVPGDDPLGGLADGWSRRLQLYEHAFQRAASRRLGYFFSVVSGSGCWW